MDSKVEFEIMKSLQHDGVIYSRGEAPPNTMTTAEIDTHVGSGRMRRIVDGVPQPTRVPSGSDKAKQILFGSDAEVLKKLRYGRHHTRLLRGVLNDARATGRSDVLIEALMLKLGIRDK